MKGNIPDYDLTALGQAIRQGRDAEGLTREQLAEIAGYSPRHIQGIETEGKSPSVELLIWLAKRYNVSLDQYLLPERDILKSTARRRADAALDKLTDPELEYIEQMAKGLYALGTPEN